MRIARCFYFVFVLTFPAFVFGQEADEEAAKEKQRIFAVLIEQIIAEIPNLQLSENQSFVYAKAGNILWQTDKNAARTLFQNAVGGMVNSLQTAVPANKNNNYQNEIMSGQATRPIILDIIAARDAAFALEALYATRPQIVAAALISRSAKSTKINGNSNSSHYMAQNEIELEQRLIRMAAEQNPERAAKLLKESLKKGISNETFNLLSRLYEKDAAAADEITPSIIDMLVKNKFKTGNQVDHQAINIGNIFLRNFLQTRPPNTKFVASDASQMRTLAERLIAFHLEPYQQTYGHYLPPIIQVAEKLVPGAVAKLKQIQLINQRRGNTDPHYEAVNNLLGGNTTPDQLLAEAQKYPPESRGRIFEQAASKIAQQGDSERARHILEENFSDEALDQALANINWNRIHDLQNTGRFSEAERLIDEGPERTRMSALINLANAAFEKNQDENRSYAVALLTKARSTIGIRPENAEELRNLMQIISAFSNIDADEAFRSLNILIPQINELVEASVIVNGFQGGSNIRQGEILMTNGWSLGFYPDQAIIAVLARKDLDKSMGLIDGFSRRESRILMKLYLAEAHQNSTETKGTRQKGRNSNNVIVLSGKRGGSFFVQ